MRRMCIRFCMVLFSKVIMSSSPICSSSLASQRLTKVEGFSGKTNDIIYHPPNGKLTNIVVYFGGDMQDYPEEMLSHRDNKNYVKWNLENVAALLHDKFPTSEIFIIKPLRMHLKTFSCYSNFMSTNDFGAPNHDVSVDALRHLILLLKNAQGKLCVQNAAEPISDCTEKEALPISLIGFSKGCVVLNQFLYSFYALSKEPDADLDTFVKRIKIMYWLDGGHSGKDNTWITDKNILQNFCNMGIKTRIHVTPYQVQCAARPRLGKEEKLFRETLKRFGCNLERTLHFEEQQQSVGTHLQILAEFKPSEL